MLRSTQEQEFKIKRLVIVNENKSREKFVKDGVIITAPAVLTPYNPVDLYNQGRPKSWNIGPEQAARTEFKIFSTGDAFSILSPKVDINAANVNIHVGLEHATYSPLVLLHEALQLCRCVSEHGAGKVTIALPEQLHPVLNPNDFNLLLMNLFEASGADKIYYYDKNYKGSLDDTNLKATIPLTLSDRTDLEKYQLGKSDLLDYLHFQNAIQTSEVQSSLDAQVMHYTRKSRLKRAWSKFDPEFDEDNANIIDTLCDKAPSAIRIPENKEHPHVLLSCSANKPLAEKMAASLRERGENVILHQIIGKGEQARIPDEANICGAVVTIVQSTRPNPDNLEETEEYNKNGATSYMLEAAMIARQARLRGADKIKLVNPYQFSARSDKAEDNPKGQTGAYVQQNGRLLEAANVNVVITAECHDTHTMSGSYTGRNIKGIALSALTIMSTRIAKEWLANTNPSMQGKFRLVTPDEGAAKRTKELTAKLQHQLGDRFCESKILGEKQRDSHKDDSAMINSLNSGSIGINEHDKYLITDDETATGNTLCQAITNLKKNGARDIAVIVVHNNMPLDWMLRQLCLARFLYLGVNDLHFSDTQEMGSLAMSYDHLLQTCAQKAGVSGADAETRVFAWFKENISKDFADKSDAHLHREFDQFKSMFTQFQSRIKVHSLASEFAYQARTRLHLDHPSEAKSHAATVVPPAVANGVYAAGNGPTLFAQTMPGKTQGTPVAPAAPAARFGT